MFRSLCCFVLCLGASLSAQDLVTNGDFQTGSTAGWTLGGYAIKPKVLSFDTTGIGASFGFSCRPGCKAGTPPPCSAYTIDQPVSVVQGVDHLLVADIAMENSLPLTNVEAGLIEFFLDGKLLKRVNFGRAYANLTKRQRVCVRFVPGVNGSKVFRVAFSRPNWGAQALTPRHHIDNVQLVRLPHKPLLCPRGERKVGGSFKLDVYGTAKSGFVVFVGLGKTAGVTLPGFAGTWYLPAVGFHLITAQFDTTGAYSMQIPLANAASAAGVPLYWQGIEAGSGGLSFGELARFGAYR